MLTKWLYKNAMNLDIVSVNALPPSFTTRNLWNATNIQFVKYEKDRKEKRFKHY